MRHIFRRRRGNQPAVPATLPPPAVTIPPNESTVSPSQTTAPAPETVLPSSKERDFWAEAVGMLPEKDKLPEEWKTTTVNRESVVGMVKAKMEECKNKEWKLEINGEEVVIREVFGKILDWIQKFAAVGDAAVQYDPVNAALPWAGFRFLLQLAVTDRETYGAMLAGLERATWLASYCAAQERLYKEYFADNDKYSDLNNAFIEDLVHLYTNILTFLLQAYRYYTKGAAARFVGAIISPSNWVKELTRAIDDRKGRMEDYASLVHKSNVHQNLKDVLGVLQLFSEYVSEEVKQRKEVERREFLSWLSDIDYKGDHDANSRNILKGSGDWMLSGEDKFLHWKAGSGLLWLCGIAGAGKTKLTSTIIDHLTRTDENHTVAYFYCIRDTKQPRKEDPEEIFRAILKQLVILLPSRLSDPVKAKYAEEKAKGGDHGSIKPLTFEDCARFIATLAASRPVTIIIDALDECRENKRDSSRGSHTDRQDLLKKLLATKHDKFRVLLSSRVDVDILRRLENYPTITINASKNGSDILDFIKSEVDDLLTDKSDWGRDATLREEIITAVSTRANGMFRFAALQIGYLSSLATRNSVRQRLRNLPTTLVQLYDEIYGRILAMVEEESSVAKRVLSWLLCAYRQLSSSQLLVAVSPNPDQGVNEDEILRLCRHLVILNPVSKSFELAHLTVREYLETRDEYRDGRPHAVVAERCIKLFDADDLEDTLSQYASLFWADHYNNRPQTEENELVDLAKKLCRNKGVNPAFRKWARLANNSWPRDYNLARRLEHAGWTSLVWAAFYERLPVLKVLKELYGDLNAKDELGWTASHWVVFLGHTRGLKVLLSAGAASNMTDNAKWTPLHWAAFLGREAEAKELATGRQDLNAKDCNELTPLQWARLAGHEATADQLSTGDAGGSIVPSLSTSNALVRPDWMPLSSEQALICLDV